MVPAETTERTKNMTTNTEGTTGAKNPPVDKLKVGSVYASIWQRVTEKGIFFSVTFERRYKDAQGKWQSTQSFSGEDLLALSKLADQAHTKTLELRLQDQA